MNKTHLKKEKLLELFVACVDNASELYAGSQQLLSGYDGKKFSSLGLAQIALEEFGKAYTCLAYYSKADNLKDWDLFWKEWKDHNIKSHRAFLFEFFCLLRVEVQSELFKDKFTLKKKFLKEKEASFYVDVDKSNLDVLSPNTEVQDIECFNRLASLLGIWNSSLHVKEWMLSKNSQSFKDAISDYAYRVMTEKIYTQDVESLLKTMKKGDFDYDRALEEIKILIK